NCLKRVVVKQEQQGESDDCPFEYALTELLGRVEQDTVALESLLGSVDTLPQQPSACNCKSIIIIIINNHHHCLVLADCGASQELQELWMYASYPNNTLMVPTEKIQQQMSNYLIPIVETR